MPKPPRSSYIIGSGAPTAMWLGTEQ